MTCSILAVIVLYKTEVQDCLSFNSLLHAAERVRSKSFEFQVLLYNNTPGTDFQGLLPPNVSILNDASNSGLATAYNRALSHASSLGCSWLLTLDQDTEVPPDGLELLCKAIKQLESRPDVAAIVPQVRASGRIVSPNYFQGGAWPRWLPPGYKGMPAQAMFAFNSGSLLRVSALRQAGGYSPWFWLDNSDANMYRQLQKLGKRVYVAGDVELQHDFSLLNMQEKVSPARYETILMAESAFWDLEMNWFAGLERTGRLAGRMVKHLLRRDSAALRRLTLHALLLRIFHSRRYRLARWRRLTAPTIARFPRPEPLSSRPKISVCMAAYNGERYILEQLQSIAPQLRANDEIVIVDDASQDATPARIDQFRSELREIPDSPEVVFLRHERNRGVVPTFEEAIRSATGDILFLCDDDDRWAPDKVAKVLEAFGDPEVQVVSTGMKLIDDQGRPIEASDFMRHRKFSAGLLPNLLHNQFQGSALALRSSLLQHILPFPTGRLYLHDAWIGMRARLNGARVVHLDEPLLFYRRHPSNFSRRFSRWKQIKLRLQLVFDLLCGSLRRA